MIICVVTIHEITYILHVRGYVFQLQHIQFNSKTHYGEQRELLYSGTLHKVQVYVYMCVCMYMHIYMYMYVCT